MSLLFGETVFTTIIASTVATAVSSAIVSKLFSREGVEFTWSYVIKPTCKGLYKMVTTSNSKPKYQNSIIEELKKDKNIVFEILSNETDENGMTTTVVVFERKPTLSFDEFQGGFNEPVFL